MLFFFKEKPIELTAIVNSDNVLACELNPIRPAREFIPSWWKAVPNSKFNIDNFETSTTIKSCVGIGQLFQNGFIMPMWSDLALKFDMESYQYFFSDRMSNLRLHNKATYPGFYDDYHTFHVDSPWKIISPVSLHYTYPTYHFDKPQPYITPGGIVKPLLNTCPTNVFLMFKRTREVSSHIISNGTPLLHILPLTEKKVKIKCEVVDTQEFNRRSKISGVFTHFVSKGFKQLSQQEKLGK